MFYGNNRYKWFINSLNEQLNNDKAKIESIKEDVYEVVKNICDEKSNYSATDELNVRVFKINQGVVNIYNTEYIRNSDNSNIVVCI